MKFKYLVERRSSTSYFSDYFLYFTEGTVTDIRLNKLENYKRITLNNVFLKKNKLLKQPTYGVSHINASNKTIKKINEILRRNNIKNVFVHM